MDQMHQIASQNMANNFNECQINRLNKSKSWSSKQTGL